MRGPQCCISIQEMAMLHVSFTYFLKCHMSNLINDYVQCPILWPICRMSPSPNISHVEFRKCPCRLVDFRGVGSSKTASVKHAEPRGIPPRNNTGVFMKHAHA